MASNRKIQSKDNNLKAFGDFELDFGLGNDHPGSDGVVGEFINENETARSPISGIGV